MLHCGAVWGQAWTEVGSWENSWVSWFSVESEFSPRILLCNNFRKMFLNSLWDHSQVTKSLLWICPVKLGSGARAAVIVVWVWLGGGDLSEASWSGCSWASECSCWGTQVWMNWWGQTCDLFTPPNFRELQNMPVSAIYYYPTLKCGWSLHWTMRFQVLSRYSSIFILMC